MKECRHVRELLSARLDHAVTATERQLIDSHLAACPRCREAQAELEKTIALLRGQEEVEPPPWLATRIMARIAEEPLPRRSFWQRLFQPWPVKVPLQALALLALCITGYLLSRENIKQVDFSAPAREHSTTPPVAPTPAQEAAPTPAPPPPRAEQRQPRTAPQPPTPTRPPAAAPAPPGLPPAMEYAPAPPAAPQPQLKSLPLLESAPTVKALRAPAAELANEAPAAPAMPRGGDATPAAAGMKRRAAKEEAAGQGGGAATPPRVLKLMADNPDTAGTEISALAQRLGGMGAAITPRSLSVQLPAQRYQDFLVGLSRLGELHDAPMVHAASSRVQLFITW